MTRYIITEEQIDRWCGCISSIEAGKIMEEILSNTYNPQAEWDNVLKLLIKRLKQANNDDPAEWTMQQILYQIEQVRTELRQSKDGG